jgi:hypothetical protein
MATEEKGEMAKLVRNEKKIKKNPDRHFRRNCSFRLGKNNSRSKRYG